MLVNPPDYKDVTIYSLLVTVANIDNCELSINMHITVKANIYLAWSKRRPTVINMYMEENVGVEI